MGVLITLGVIWLVVLLFRRWGGLLLVWMLGRAVRRAQRRGGGVYGNSPGGDFKAHSRHSSRPAEGDTRVMPNNAPKSASSSISRKAGHYIDFTEES